jgi:hypothetical protein
MSSVVLNDYGEPTLYQDLEISIGRMRQGVSWLDMAGPINRLNFGFYKKGANAHR